MRKIAFIVIYAALMIIPAALAAGDDYRQPSRRRVKQFADADSAELGGKFSFDYYTQNISGVNVDGMTMKMDPTFGYFPIQNIEITIGFLMGLENASTSNITADGITTGISIGPAYHMGVRGLGFLYIGGIVGYLNTDTVSNTKPQGTQVKKNTYGTVYGPMIGYKALVGPLIFNLEMDYLATSREKYSNKGVTIYTGFAIWI